jgi:hypothetical protein
LLFSASFCASTIRRINILRDDVSCRVQDQSILGRVCLDHIPTKENTKDDNYYSNRKLISLERQSQEKHEIAHLGLSVCQEQPQQHKVLSPLMRKTLNWQFGKVQLCH